VGFSPLGLPRGEFSGPAAVVWNSVYIVAACGGGTPGGLVKKIGYKNAPTPQLRMSTLSVWLPAFKYANAHPYNK
jgi:hypothetical protein